MSNDDMSNKVLKFFKNNKAGVFAVLLTILVAATALIIFSKILEHI